MDKQLFFDRDLSWLSFNERVLTEASNAAVPLIERIRFLSIYSSNLDEFYRVRMPALMALDKQNNPLKDTVAVNGIYEKAAATINRQQQLFGSILTQQLIPQLQQNNIHLVYNEALPETIKQSTTNYFFTTIVAYIEVVFINREKNFFPENNRLYIAVDVEQNNRQETALVNIPSHILQRFYCTNANGIDYVVFIDDIIKANLSSIFPKHSIHGAYSIKITRDAELDLQDEYEGDIAEKMEKQLTKRDFGLATRFLYPPNLPAGILRQLVQAFKLYNANTIQGGNYHNLKDLSSFPSSNTSLQYPKQTAIEMALNNTSLFDEILQKDILISPPYQSYNTILRFFNEAAINEDVEEIYTTMYRVASDSRIVNALISAAKNGKKVTVFVELKARFDEANNIKWAKHMKAAGVKTINNIPNLKVHAKVALVKKKAGNRTVYLGLLATGNLNETTAKFYTDHILLTSHKQMLRELELVFLFLCQRKKVNDSNRVAFQHLLVAQFNLQQKFISLIDNEIVNAKNGLASGITIKLNNLEEEVLINKLYEASQAGVKVQLIVRGICRIIPGTNGMSDNITVRRIVDRYLEHGRVFIFCNNNSELFFLGSSDWMNRNIYRRVEVCFPLYDEGLKQLVKNIINLQLQDNMAAVIIDENMNNVAVLNDLEKVRSQQAIYHLLQTKNTIHEA